MIVECRKNVYRLAQGAILSKDLEALKMLSRVHDYLTEQQVIATALFSIEAIEKIEELKRTIS